MSDLFSVAGKTAVVTGGSRGIGYMIAGEFLKAGARRVYICARKAEACDAAAAELSQHGDCVSVPCDVGQPEGVEKLARAVEEREERLEILVNNAGTAWGAPLDSHPIEQVDRVLQVNVRAVFHLTQRLLPLLRAAASAEDPARVVNIGSIDGLAIPMTPNYGYSASKAAVHMLTRHLAHALVGDHVNVNAIAPGLFPSRMTRWAFEGEEAATVLGAIPMHRAGTAEDAGGTAIYLCSRAGAYLTGVVIPVAGGLATIDGPTATL
ncbi:MAG: 3-oxoacyl-ACP reductase [Candidatus Nephthysia bennettiae]|uniref:SDR family oxidoreductase n=1 Tax=Candidatus Nephthysia bennettiae TaxID=3127016 RepID=A0A934KCK1_9BACT|nr:SDR family oxidoreductase [Candidatus Dormibacteraeota bacterium]MBJ7610695.1 SDR family oxidoreductase [Candidatus Dormibacteraeota bacterium]PZR99479.1 MAG: 3-oxoacyl-ACP reductase [Candidatus Dormibacteraeota bacterium]